jgi:hypothetical protein
MAEFALGCAEADYLLYWDANGAKVALLDAAAKLPQYARSVVARHLDASAMPYDWDWALRADDELLVQTLTAARAGFRACDDMKAKNGEHQPHGEIA